jgi:hypothetical protein
VAPAHAVRRPDLGVWTIGVLRPRSGSDHIDMMSSVADPALIGLTGFLWIAYRF